MEFSVLEVALGSRPLVCSQSGHSSYLSHLGILNNVKIEHVRVSTTCTNEIFWIGSICGKYTLIHYIYLRLFEHKGLNKGDEAEGVCGLSVGKFNCKILRF